MTTTHTINGRKPTRPNDSRMPLAGLILVILLPGILSLACTIDIPNPLPTGTPFIVKGTYELRQVFGKGDCPVWVAETGMLYHLFQDDTVSNADFDAVTTPGVTSRLRIATRSDLTVACELGTTVVVKAVLEVVQ